MDALEKAGVRDNTIIVFSSDNGPVYDDGYADGCLTMTSKKETDQGHDGSGIYRGGKYQIYEGGTRVPFIISWPAKIKPGKSDAMLNQVDLYASFAKLIGHKLKDGEAIDSRNTLAAFLGQSQKGLDYSYQEANILRAVRKGPWKYVRIIPGKNPRWYKGPELYNLENDPSEQKNVLKEYPEVVKDLDKLINKIENSEKGIR